MPLTRRGSGGAPRAGVAARLPDVGRLRDRGEDGRDAGSGARPPGPSRRGVDQEPVAAETTSCARCSSRRRAGRRPGSSCGTSSCARRIRAERRGGARPVGCWRSTSRCRGAGDSVRPARRAARPVTFPAAPDEDAAARGIDDMLLREVRDGDGTCSAGSTSTSSARGEVQPRRGLRPGARPTGRRRPADPALATLVTNFSPPRGDRPGLLRHDEIGHPLPRARPRRAPDGHAVAVRAVSRHRDRGRLLRGAQPAHRAVGVGAGGHRARGAALVDRGAAVAGLSCSG